MTKDERELVVRGLANLDEVMDVCGKFITANDLAVKSLATAYGCFNRALRMGDEKK